MNNDHQQAAFADRVIAWQRNFGRHDLPWQNTRDAYRIWLSEIMLQQTQVAAVVRYYARFLERFPTLESLAAAPVDDVMAVWSGLGYYSRARNLHACARRIASEFGGRFPSDPHMLATLPGIGRSTAAAIVAFAFGERAAILDGNVKRVFARHWAIEGWPGEAKTERALWAIAERECPQHEVPTYIQGLMDLGATLCTRSKPLCDRCPVASTCLAFAQHRVSELPVPKPRKAVPKRDAFMLVALHDGEVLLEKRRSPGIWGGLWSLPQFEERSQLEHTLSTLTPYARRETLAPRTHGFTHFTLSFTPFVARLTSRPLRATEPESLQWLALSQLDGAALPAPIRKLLEEVARLETPKWP